VPGFAVRTIPLAETRVLRQAVLRPHQTVEDVAAHEVPGAVAVGAFDGDELVAVGLVGPDGGPGAWRVRGMATAPAARRRGAGAAVLDGLVRHALEAGATRVWCNARTPARSLYERAGFAVVSDEFELPDIGPHLVMELRAFRGFGAVAFEWFEGLERDNSKEYFTATRERYETDVRGAFEAMLRELGESLGGEPRVFRQHRDLRFSRDRTPYKTRTYGVLAGVPGAAAGLYAELSGRGLYAGTGYHGLARDQLARFRAAVADDAAGADLERRVAAARQAGLEVVGETLRTAPRGFGRDHPRIALLRHGALVAGRRLPGAGGIGREAALEHVAGTWRAAAPLTAWLDEHVGPSAEPGGRRG